MNPEYAKLLKSGKVWFDENTKLWNSLCPLCGRLKTYSSKDRNSRHSACKLSKLNCRSCKATISNTGRKHTEETKRKRSLALKGEKSPCWGTHRSDEVKRKMSLTTKGIPKSPEHFNKIQESAFKRKDYVFPDGRIEKVQGYEPFTLDYLLFNDSILPDDIVIQTKDKPVISYEYEGHKHNYFSDCYVKSTNTIVETKSQYTWENKLEQNVCKVMASAKQGYNVRVLIWDNKKVLIKEIHVIHRYI
jgi:hypothetical protein